MDETRLLNDFSDLFLKEKAKRPYHFNLLDAMGSGFKETAHSRVLARLLSFKSPEGNFEILQSWLNLLRCLLSPQQDSQPIFDFKVDKPEILVEQYRIDILIKDRSYAIIVENKSNWAVDQEAQLSCYIDKTVKLGYKPEQIFVLYLPPSDAKDPTDQTRGPYRNDFDNRYVKLSWQNNIVPWLKDKILPNVRYKDGYLVSALEQYIDHWDGRCGSRNVDREMNAALKAFVIKELKWDTARTNAKLANLSITIQAVEAMLPAMRNSNDLYTVDATEKLISVLRGFLKLVHDGTEVGFESIDPRAPSSGPMPRPSLPRTVTVRLRYVCPIRHLSVGQMHPRVRPEHVRLRVRVPCGKPDQEVDVLRRIRRRQPILVDDQMKFRASVCGREFKPLLL